ncbi:MAG: riboflavin synthase [Elusimicrobia bacterium CG02_land_8_20_14_3_00_37_13]|nr:MAG: riboflavin synthase [Elusimicrobia bacterium CG02_land_8_20_14_3_00_37_13]
MFTGIIEDLGIVQNTGRAQLNIKTNLPGIKVSDSLAINGACLTVADCLKLNNIFSLLTFDISSETLNRTNLGNLRKNERVNLERAMTPSDRLGGHIVTGHIECTGKILSIKTDGKNKIYSFSAPGEIIRYVVTKGSIALDGVSLTVVDMRHNGRSPVSAGEFSVSVVPLTFKNTTLGFKKSGDVVNIEPDIMAKYAEKAEKDRSKEQEKREITTDFLRNNGFLW